jgi:hypothetical protein
MSTIGTTAAFDLGGDVIPYDLVHLRRQLLRARGGGGTWRSSSASSRATASCAPRRARRRE